MFSDQRSFYCSSQFYLRLIQFAKKFSSFLIPPKKYDLSVSIGRQISFHRGNSSIMKTAKGQLAVLLIKFRHSYYAHVHSCIVLLEKNFLFDQMWSFFFKSSMNGYKKLAYYSPLIDFLFCRCTIGTILRASHKFDAMTLFVDRSAFFRT